MTIKSFHSPQLTSTSCMSKPRPNPRRHRHGWKRRCWSRPVPKTCCFNFQRLVTPLRTSAKSFDRLQKLQGPVGLILHRGIVGAGAVSSQWFRDQECLDPCKSCLFIPWESHKTLPDAWGCISAVDWPRAVTWHYQNEAQSFAPADWLAGWHTSLPSCGDLSSFTLWGGRMVRPYFKVRDFLFFSL